MTIATTSTKSTLRIIPFLMILLTVIACNQDKPISSDQRTSEATTAQNTSNTFSIVSKSQSSIDFSNIVTPTVEANYLNFSPIYDGGGVAIGDINNDGLADIYFTGNQVSNKLYLNKGDMKFQDITESAKVGGGDGWHNGASMVDVNGDGFLDLYVCRGGHIKEAAQRKNLLFINNRDNTFSEQAESYGLAGTGYSFHAAFFDYDNDNDLDVYIINHPAKSNLQIEEYKKGKKSGHPDSKDKLYRNNGDNTFTDATFPAKLGFNYGFGLSVTTSDLDGNGYADIYVTNDYTEHDYMWMNNGDGTFTDKIKTSLKHIPLFAMGTDIADINNDGLEDIFNTEMLPYDYKKSKTSMAAMNTTRFNEIVSGGFHHQYMHNMLQLNQGQNVFSEISQMTGLAKTDWSWACFLSDFNNDGLRDAFVSNGYRKETLDRDSGKKIGEYMKANGLGNYNVRSQQHLDAIMALLSEQKSQNQFFTNEGDMTFSKTTKSSLPAQKTFSNGAAIGDLDNDGDLDVVVNNMKDASFIYENKSSGNNYLRVKLNGPKLNNTGIGAKIILTADGEEQVFHFKTTRGYLASVEPIAHFGLGNVTQVDELKVVWPDRRVALYGKIAANQILEVNYMDSAGRQALDNTLNAVAPDATEAHFSKIHKHKENANNDFRLQVLLPHSLSKLGPFVETADVNNDGLQDFYIGGAHNSAGTLYIQDANAQFKSVSKNVFNQDKNYEDMGAHFFDADGDKDLDLYVVSGGTELPQGNEFYNDRLYLNNGKGSFSKSPNFKFKTVHSGSCVKSCDYDKDGDLDLFVGGRVIPDYYPLSPRSYLLNNNKGFFNNVSDQWAEEWNKIGMVTDALWTDLNKDGWEDLMIVGEWMDVTIFMNEQGQLRNRTTSYISQKTSGWWNTIEQADLDNDGDMDFVLGNLGENYKFKASPGKPFTVYASDFDQNGSCDVVLTKYDGDQQVPVRGRQCMSEQMPGVSQMFPSYTAFANADIKQILGTGTTSGFKFEAVTFSSMVLWNENGKLRVEKLPKAAQIAPVNGIVIEDFNADGLKDIIIAGNMYNAEIETTRADAGIGLVLINNEDSFKPLNATHTGLYLPHDVKDLKSMKMADGKHVIMAASNNSDLRLIQLIVNQ